ncbi:MAG: 6-phosphogluconolactonase [Gemmatimonadota bacterium]
MIEVAPDPAGLANRAATRIVATARRAIADRGECVLLLSGGTTPQATYARLASPEFAGQVDWSRVHIALGDERYVPADDPRSNFRMIREILTSRVPIPVANVHPVDVARPPIEAALAYERTLRTLLGSGRPDLVLLGLGDDGHTASLFPGHAAVREQVRWVVAEEIAEQVMWRITVTPPLLNAAREVIFLVSGAAKADVLRSVLEPPRDPDSLPAQVIHPGSGRLDWLVDEAAAGR